MTEDEQEPMYENLVDFVLHQRRLNDERAAQATRAFMDSLRAQGFRIQAGIEEAMTLRVLKLLNEHLERESAGIAERLATSEPPPVPLLH